MSNVTTVRPIEPYLPSCSGFTVQDFRNEFESRGTAFNLSNTGKYVYDEVVPSLIPGIVVGCVALFFSIFFLCWLCAGCIVSYCCCCRRKQRHAQQLAAQQAGASEQFISGQGGSQPSAAFGYPAYIQQPKRAALSWRNLFWALFFALSLAIIGVSAWGLAESIQLTDYTVSDFWGIVGEAQNRVELTIQSMQALQEGADRLSNSSAVLASNRDGVVQSLQAVAQTRGIALPLSTAESVADVLSGAPSALQQGSGAIGQAITFLQDNVNQTIADIRDDFEPPTMAVQETWRFIPFAVIFGVTILVTALLMPLIWKMTWPKTAACLTALLWLCICLLMLLGTGLLNGVHVVATDACLFAETFAVDYVNRRTQGSQWGETVTDMVQYYIGQNVSISGTNLIPSGTGNAALEALRVYLPAGAQTSIGDIDNLLQSLSGATEDLAAAATDPSVKQGLSGIAGPQVADALQSTGLAVGSLNDALTNLTVLANRTNAEGVYRNTKVYICCDLRDSFHNMWVAWTVVGVLGFVMALMASAVVVNVARTRRKRMKAAPSAALGGGALWAKEPPHAAKEAGELPTSHSAAPQATAGAWQGQLPSPAPSRVSVQPIPEALPPGRGAAWGYGGPSRAVAHS